MKSISYSQLQERYGGKFIAKVNSQVIASAKTSKTLWNKVRDRIGNSSKMIIEYIEPKGALCTYEISHP
jgi:hypothetical protein